MTWDTIKEKVLEAVIHALVIGIGLVVVYSISIVLVGDAKLQKIHDDSVARDSEIIARVTTLEGFASKMSSTPTVGVIFTNNPAPVVSSPPPSPANEPQNLIESLKNVQQVQQQYKQSYIQKN